MMWLTCGQKLSIFSCECMVSISAEKLKILIVLLHYRQFAVFKFYRLGKT